MDGLQKNIVMDGGTMIDGTTGDVLGPEVDFYVLERQILRVDFIGFVDHKMPFCTVEEPHVLNGTKTLDT